MRDYSTYYATLGVTPKTDWKALRTRYKSLIGQWHPDRHQASSDGKRIAEERTKEITLAYKALSEYRRAHGVLPPLEPMVAEAFPPYRASARSGAEQASASVKETKPSSPSSTRSEVIRHKRGLGRAATVILGAGVTVFYFAQTSRDAEVPVSSSPARSVSPMISEAPPPKAQEGISVGMTVGEVYAIQGVPTRTLGEIWYYGKSEVHFTRGKVTSWKEHAENPLRVDLDQSTPSRQTTFRLGSTKEEVRAIQGTPVAETDTVWDYAPSRVYFERDRVIRWEESPMQLLHVPR